MKHIVFTLLLAPTAALAAGADVHFLGEQHDNPAHHARQAERVAEIAPRALVFEMLTQDQANRITPALIADETALEATLGWNESGWPDFSMYYPIFAAAPEATYYGAAVPREQARRMMSETAVDIFGPDASLYGLTDPLPEDQQQAREALQLAAHCDAMPAEMLPVMVEIQRLRDAFLARAALTALEDHGAPVAVITGNGHARTDWGAPAALRLAAPDVTFHALGQGETGFGDPEGAFDSVEITDTVERGDPCAAFQKDG
ncbi:ChaN family lipoprotein [Thetidibacter halocola]|uniref:ChaN family lipoprotein n=1 Tax=Thetidibacter halocola TaxID=2827239 RepID=A0A8J7WGU5_9RHOB|nr:ChaN family lipoprotein [Thetidibacter halocola]MBS0124764.1 ChaN family lipoprotein [Thetidibacter halocola]